MGGLVFQCVVRTPASHVGFTVMKKARIIRLILILAVAVAAIIAVRLYLDRPSNRIEASVTIETTEVDVSFQVAGKVQELLVKEGDHVNQGQTVAKYCCLQIR